MADDGLLSLNPTPEQTEPLLQLNNPDAVAPASAEVASARAYKASTSIPELGMSYDEVNMAINSGQEEDVRQKAAVALDLKKSEQRSKFIIGATSQERGLPKVDPKYVAQAIQNPPQPTDPKSVIEDAFAKSWMNQLDDTSSRNDTLWGQLKEDQPDASILIKTAGERFSAQREFIKKELDDAQQAADIPYFGGVLGTDTPEERRVRAAKNYNSLLDIGTFGLHGEYEGRNLTGKGSFFKGLLGTNLEDAATDLLRTPKYEDFKTKFSTIMEGLKRDNPDLAVMFGNYVLGKSPDDKMYDNVMSAINLSILPSIAGGATKLLRKGASAAITKVEVDRAVKEIVQAKTDPTLSPAVANASAVGDASEAAVKQVSNNITRDFEGTASKEKEALDSLVSGMRADRQEMGAEGQTGHWGREQVNRFQEQQDKGIIDTAKVIGEMSKVERINAALATEGATRRILDFIKDKYPGISNSIMDIRTPRWNSATNTYDVDMFLGWHRAELFFKKEEAEALIEREGLAGATIKQDKAGLGYYVSLSKPLNETDSIIRDLTHEAILHDKEHLSRRGPILDFATWLKTPEDTLSFQSRVNRKVAAYGQNTLEQLVKENGRYIKDVARGIVKVDPVTGEKIGLIRNRLNTVPNYLSGKTKKVWSEFDRTLRANRDMYDPAIENPTALDKGYFFKTPKELDDFYMTNFKRDASFEETSAYFAYVRNIELDRTLRNLSVFRNKSRVGAEQHQFTMLNDKGELLKSNFFDGVQRKVFPGGKDNDILVIGDNGEATLHRSGSGSMSGKTLQDLKDGVGIGKYRAVEVYDPELRQFEGLSDAIGSARIRYVVSKNIETKPLSWDQVPRRGGGHFDYDYDHYIKQANIRPERIKKSVVHWYEGDTTFMPVSLRAQGHKIKDSLNEIRALMASDKMNEAKALFESKMPVQLQWKEFRSWFEPSMKNGKEVPPRLNVKEPFYVVPRGKTIQELGSKELELRYTKGDVSTFKDGTKSGSLARQHQVQYTGQRDAHEMFTFKDEGHPGNPIYKYEPATMVDPIPSMNRGLQRIINSTFMDDYKTFAIEHWLQEARDLLKASKGEIEASPFWHFNNPDWKPIVKSSEGRAEWSRLMSNRFKIMQFVGQPNNVDLALHSISQHLADTLYTKWGPRGPGIGSVRLDPAWVASSLKDPFSFIRTMTFHAKLGLYAIPQMWIQAQTYALILGASPINGVMGTQAATLHQFARLNPTEGVLNILDKIASTQIIPGVRRLKPGEWKEAFQELHKTGFGHVGGEYSVLDTAMSPQVVTSMGHDILNAGAVFFREGERFTRFGAWYTAYGEFRTANPLGRITNLERNKILERADILTSNMSRASQSLLHNGVLSFPAQFLTYQIRNAELFWGKRLADTVAERNWARARILGVYSALYGIPGALGVSGLPIGDSVRQVMLGGQSSIPFVESIKKYATDHNYVIGDNYLETLAMEGIPAMIAAHATGENWDASKGNFYNIGPRYGNQGFTSMREAFMSDQTVWKLIGGAAGSTFSNTIANLSPFYEAGKAWIDGDAARFKPKPEDVIRAAQEIASVHMAHQAYIGATTHQWLSKSGAFVDSVSPANALFMSAFGLSPQKQVDAFSLNINHKAELEIQKTALKFFLDNAHAAQRAMRDNDKPTYEDYMRRATSYLDSVNYPREKREQAFALAAKGYESMIVGSERNYNLGKDIPEDERARRRKTQEVIEQQNYKKEQGK